MQIKMIVNRMLPVFAMSAVVFFVGCDMGRVVAVDKTPDQSIAEAKKSINRVTVGDVKNMIDAKENIVLLDVRNEHEFEQGHIPGAINIPRGSLEFDAVRIIPDKNARIIVYCGTDRRSVLATRTMNDMGYKNAVDMTGGLKAWKEAGYPTVR